jgi:hypothetical protein
VRRRSIAIRLFVQDEVMNRFHGRLARTALLVSLAMVAACHSGDITTDNWGPPAGYSRLTGRVTTTAGLPIPSAAVSVGLCRNVGGFTSTSNDGSYRLTLSLPPVGAFVGRADTVRARCGVLVDGSLMDSLEVRFAADSLSMPSQVLNLIVP